MVLPEPSVQIYRVNVIIMETVRFEDLNLSDAILRAVTDMGFEAASPIQAQAIPAQLEGRDMIGQAQTGTGKTFP